MRILAIDPSLTGTGLAFPDRSTRLLAPSKFDGIRRLIDLRDRLRAIVREVAPQVAILEDYAWGMPQAAVPLGEWGGVLRVMLWEADVPMVLVNPTHLKMWQLGKAEKKKPKGEEAKPRGKDAALMAMASQTGIAFPDNNQADAWSLASMAAAYIGEPWFAARADQAAALGRVHWPAVMVRERELAFLDPIAPPAPKVKAKKRKVPA